MMIKTNLEEIEIGPTPHEEDCAQAGEDGYSKRSMRECAAYKAQILRHYPIPEGAIAGIRITLNPHELGSYREVVVAYGDQAGFEWAASVEKDSKGVLATWDDKARAELGLQKV